VDYKTGVQQGNNVASVIFLHLCHVDSVNTTQGEMGVQHTYVRAFPIIKVEENQQIKKSEPHSEWSPYGILPYTVCR
jgi:hypothetical protein